MDKRRYILFSFVLAIILVQGTATSFISPSLNGFAAELENRYNGASPEKLPVQKVEAGPKDVAVCQNVFSQHQIFPLVAIDSGAFGSKVLYSDGDIGRVLNDFESDTDLRFWDVGIIDGEFDGWDVVYYHINGNSSNIEQNDIRLTQLGNRLPGSKVTAYDIDFNKALTSFSGDYGIKFADQYGSSGYDLMDPVYFSENGSEIVRMDLRLSYFAYGSPGTLVNGHDPDQGLATAHLDCKIKFYNINGNIRTNGKAIYDEMDPVYLDIPGRDNPGFVLVNDVRLS
jgi:hypothetical protein